jgi:hypothetical protein
MVKSSVFIRVYRQAENKHRIFKTQAIPPFLCAGPRGACACMAFPGYTFSHTQDVASYNASNRKMMRESIASFKDADRCENSLKIFIFKYF